MNPEEIRSLYQDIRLNLDFSRKALISTSILGEDDSPGMHSSEETLHILDTLEKIALSVSVLLETYPSLDSLYEKAFGPIREIFDRESIVETCLIEDHLFPQLENYALFVDDKFSEELVKSYPDTFQAWCDDKKEKHEKTQIIIKEKFDLKLNSGDVPCQCVQCLGDFRAKVREYVFDLQTKLIDDAEENLHEVILFKKLNDVANAVFNVKKDLDKTFNFIRHKLKRSSLNKLESEIKSHFRSKFGPNSSLGKVYKEKLNVFFNTLLVEQGYKPEIVSPEEYDRFYLMLETNIWKNESFLRKEFEKFIRSILALKRKDVSSTILKEYLGQFWIHAEARRLKRKIVYHMGPTNSGKTYHAIEALCAAKKGCYLAPLRLLASELFDTMNNKGVKTNLLTGEEVIEVQDATHFASTIEMAKLHEHFDCCVIDEIQMLTDTQRGWAWTRALVSMQADEIHLCGDHSVLELVKRILELTGDTLEIREYTRMTELKVMPNTITLSALEKNDALIVFSRRNALKFKADLENLDFKVSIVYGRLSPEVRREQARKFDEGETDIMVSTDAIAMGMNLPVKRIVFSALSKFIDNREIPLTMSEIKQIAGRAGRFKRFPVGHVTTLQKVDGGIQMLNEAITHKLNQQDKAMVGPDLEIFKSVNDALSSHSLPTLSLSEFLRLFNTMIFQKPFFCVDLKEMIELAEMVEAADEDKKLTDSEIFGFACAPVNLGMIEHVQYYLWILSHYVGEQSIYNEPIDETSDNIDYLETTIKCVELFQWLSRHFSGKYFTFDEKKLLENKSKAIERLNELLSEKTTKSCSSCGCKMSPNSRFNICDNCFNQRRQFRRGPRSSEGAENPEAAQADGVTRPVKPSGGGFNKHRHGGGKGKGPKRPAQDNKKPGPHSGGERHSSTAKKPSGGSTDHNGGKPRKDKASAFRKFR
ncbi:MAG: helicase-related protein [Bacteriovoracaceae bacterium]